MKKILCYISKTVSQVSDFKQSYKDNFQFKNGNTGNYLFSLALEKFLTNDKCDVTFSDKSFYKKVPLKNYKYINENFDMVIFSTENILNVYNEDDLKYMTKYIKKIKIPVHFIGIGIQYEFDEKSKKELFENKSVREFIEAVGNTGGKFALRGYRTAEIFDYLKMDNYCVTGCPSLILNGRDFKIQKKELSPSEIKPILNGRLSLFAPEINYLFNKYPESIFVDQARFYRMIYQKNKLFNHIRYCKPLFLKRFNQLTLDLLNANRIKLFCDIPYWFDYIKKKGFNVSLGTRIHGNIASLLCNIPAIVVVHDARVAEISDFYKIPTIPIPDKNVDLFDVYNNADYTEFNKILPERYDNWQKFFDENDIPCVLGNNEAFDKKIASYNFESIYKDYNFN